MKPFLLSIIILTAFFNGLLAQQYKTFKLSTDKPEVGQQLKFLYTGVFSQKLLPTLTLYYTVGNDFKWLTLDVKHAHQGIDGSFTVPDSATSLCIKARNSRDTTEAYIYNVYRQGEMIKGSLAIAAQTFLYNDIIGISDHARALSFFEEEFSKYPELRAKHLLAYYQFIASPFHPAPAVSEQLVKTWKDSLSNGSSEQFLVRLSLIMALRSSPEWQQFKTQIIAKYPTGGTALEDDLASLKNQNLESLLPALELKYNALIRLGQFDRIYAQLARQKIEAGDIAGGERYIIRIKSPFTKGGLFVFAAKAMLKNNQELLQAESFIQEATNLLKLEQMPYYVFDKQNWAKTLEGKRGGYLALTAQIKFALNDKAGAINLLKEALEINNYDNSIKELYVHYLLEAGETEAALHTATDYIEADCETETIDKLLQQAYVKHSGSTSGYDVYYQTILKKRDLNYKLADYNQINIKSIDFSLEGLNGKTISLSDYKGKPVVLFFLNTDNINPQEPEREAAFNEIVNEYKASDIVFLAIDESWVSDNDESTGKPLRIAKINTHLAKNNVTFKVLMDNYHRDLNRSNNSYHIVADNYSGGERQFYIIDKNQMVKYRSLNISPFSIEKFKRELQQALKLAP